MYTNHMDYNCAMSIIANDGMALYIRHQENKRRKMAFVQPQGRGGATEAERSPLFLNYSKAIQRNLHHCVRRWGPRQGP